MDYLYDNTLFICCADPMANVVRDDLYEIMIRNGVFAQKIVSMITPIIPTPRLDVPKNKITVAILVRKGSGGDRILSEAKGNLLPLHKYEDYANPEKFPSDEYFIEHIKLLSMLLNDMPLYVYIFTDAVIPSALVEYYTRAVAKPNIEFACRKTANNSDTLVLEDFFSMSYQFDCLIRGKSCFAYASQCIGHHKIIICTQHASWVASKGVVVDQAGIIVRNKINNTIQRMDLKEQNYEKIQQALYAFDWSYVDGQNA